MGTIQVKPSNMSNRVQVEPSNMSHQVQAEPSNLSNRVQAESSNMSHYASVSDVNQPVVGGNPIARQTNSNSYNTYDLSASNSRSELLPPSSIDSSDSSHEYQITLQDVEKLSILTKGELVSICKRNDISVTGEKQALAARILRKLGKIFD